MPLNKENNPNHLHNPNRCREGPRGTMAKVPRCEFELQSRLGSLSNDTLEESIDTFICPSMG